MIESMCDKCYISTNNVHFMFKTCLSFYASNIVLVVTLKNRDLQAKAFLPLLENLV